MAYTLGFLYADGTLLDARHSSRTQYIKFSSKDFDLIEQIKNSMGSSHSITRTKSGYIGLRQKKYFHTGIYELRIGSKKMFEDLLLLGLKPRKSLVLRFPDISPEYFPLFLRGYFDGDGCIHIESKNIQKQKLSLIFTCGSKRFLASLKKQLSIYLSLQGGSLCNGDHAYQLRYRKKDGLRILEYMYQTLDQTPYLERKYKIYQQFLELS